MIQPVGPQNPGRFIGLYGVANAGAFIAFVPLLTLLLPLKAEVIDAADKILLLSITLLCGAAMASIANIIAGWASDKIYLKRKSRIGQIAFGLILVLSAYFLFWMADSWTGLIASILVFQLSFNILFSPLGALLADHIPDGAKGRTSAILNLGLPIGTLTVAALTLAVFDSEADRLLAIAVTIVCLILPLLLFANAAKPVMTDSGMIEPMTNAGIDVKADLVWAWLARFSVQFSGAVLFGYILYYLQDVAHYANTFPGEKADQGLGKLAVIATPVSVILGILIGYWSDQIGLRRPFLIFSTIAVCLSMLGMVVWPVWILPAYVVFAAGLTAYLTIDAALVAQLLSHSAARAKILGFMNLTNTTPAILTPALAIILSQNGLQDAALISLMSVAAVMAFAGSFAVAKIRSVA